MNHVLLLRNGAMVAIVARVCSFAKHTDFNLLFCKINSCECNHCPSLGETHTFVFALPFVACQCAGLGVGLIKGIVQRLSNRPENKRSVQVYGTLLMHSRHGWDIIKALFLTSSRTVMLMACIFGEALVRGLYSC